MKAAPAGYGGRVACPATKTIPICATLKMQPAPVQNRKGMVFQMQTITADVFQNLKKFIAENLIQPSSRQERQDGRYSQFQERENSRKGQFQNRQENRRTGSDVRADTAPRQEIQDSQQNGSEGLQYKGDGKEQPDHTGGRSMDSLIGEVGASFREVLFDHIKASGMTNTEVYKRANIDRKLFSKIRTNPAYHPGKSTVLALAVALKLDLEDTADLLARAEYALSPGSVGDLIVRYFIEHGIYDLQVINTALNEYDQPILG